MVEAPAQGDVDDIQHSIPYFPVGPDLTIQIPAEYMPSEIQAVHYFDIFFTHIHPYVPVLNKHLFYNQWYSNRESISPLILEAIFACAGRLSDDPTQGLKWLALAGSMDLFQYLLDVILTLSRARRLVHGCSSTEHHTGVTYHPKSS